MKRLTELSRSKESQNILKIVFNELPIEKWDTHKKVDLKESMESSTFMFR
jgi:hypothetical protein